MQMTKDGEQTGVDGERSAIPSDLISSREACERFGLRYSTLMGWWNRGAIRRWKRGMFNLVSASEVAQAVERFQTIREVPPPYTTRADEDDEADGSDKPS